MKWTLIYYYNHFIQFHVLKKKYIGPYFGKKRLKKLWNVYLMHYGAYFVMLWVLIHTFGDEMRCYIALIEETTTIKNNLIFILIFYVCSMYVLSYYMLKQMQIVNLFEVKQFQAIAWGSSSSSAISWSRTIIDQQ